MSINEDFSKIMERAHYWNWLPDWDITQQIYRRFPDSYSVLTPFAYTYLEELIRSTTSEYGMELLDSSGEPKKRKVGMKLIALAIEENKGKNDELVTLLEQMKSYFSASQLTDSGDNRNSVVHGYMHPRFWDKSSFEQLIHDIASLSKHAGF